MTRRDSEEEKEKNTHTRIQGASQRVRSEQSKRRLRIRAGAARGAGGERGVQREGARFVSAPSAGQGASPRSGWEWQDLAVGQGGH